MTTLNLDVVYRDHGADRGMRNLGQQTERTSKRFSGLKVAGAAALAAVGVAAVKFGADSVKAYVEAESSQIRLQDAFRKFPKLADTNIGSLQKLNSQLALKTRFDDDATASGQAVLAQFGLTGKQLTTLTPLLQDYAAKTGKDLPAAAGVLGKAFLGNTRALKAIGIDYKMTGNKAVDFTNIQRLVNEKVGGFAEKEGKSAAGQAAILRNQFGELQETAGQKLLPALLKIGSGLLSVITYVQDSNGVFGSFKRIVSATFGAFSESVGLGKVSFKGFADFISTNQANITRGIVAGAKVVLAFGGAFATLAEAGLRGAALLMDGYANLTEMLFGSFRGISRAAVLAFGWIPGVGDRIKEADAKFAAFSETTVGGMRRAAAGARGAADGIDNKLRPALDAAGRKLDEVGKKEIIKAAARDAVNRASQAIRDLGTKTDGTQIRIKKFSDITRLSTNEQRAFRQRLAETRQRMLEQREAGIKAGESQKQLTTRWNLGRQALEKEFRQMGLSKEEARKLAVRYSQVPKSVQVKHSTPGAQAARTGAVALKNRLAELKDKKLNITFATNAASVAGKFNVNFANSRELTVRRAAGGPIQNVSGRGRRGVDTEPVLAAVGEHMWTDREVAAVGGHRAMHRMRQDALAGKLRGYAEGGPIRRNVVVTTGDPGVSRVPSAFDTIANRVARAVGVALGTRLRDALAAAVASAGAGSSASWRGGSFKGLSNSQMNVAAAIASVGAGMGKKAQLIGLIAGLVESRLTNVNYGDRDSLGVFQQRAPWGPASVRRNVRASAGMFFHGGRGGQRGLDDIGGWRGMSPGRAAQRVQVSAFPGRYATQVPLALSILSALTASRGAAALAGSGRGGSWMGGTRPVPGSAKRHSGYPWANWAGDFKAGGGTPIRAWRAGYASAVNRWGFSYGHHVRAKHAGGPETLSAHMSRIAVRRGQRFGQGAIIGYVGSTGNATGNHLHWEVKGLRDGGVVRRPSIVGVGENGPERILPAPVTRTFDRMVRVMERGGTAGGTTIINISAPNYIGSRSELRDALVEMNRRGQLEVIKQR